MTSQSRKSHRAELKTGAFISLDGKHLNVNDPHWRLNRDVLIDFEEVGQLVSSDVFKGYVSTLAAFAADSSANYVSNLHWYYVHFLRFSTEAAINTKKTIAYREYLGGDREYYLLPVRALFTRWRALGIAGIDQDVVDMLVAWRIKGNIKGDAVKRLDLEEGPLSDIELQGLLEKTVLAYEAGILNVTETSLLMLAAASARRPIQLTSLKLKDLYDRPGTDGFSHYIVNLPRAKQGGTFRSSFRELEVTRELWDVLEVQKEFVISVFKQCLGHDLSEDSRRELPLFFHPPALERRVVRRFDQLNLGDFFHMHSESVTSLLKRVVKLADVHSERTGTILRIHARRLRYTLGSRAAREGYGVLVIAELLDHSDTQNAHVYTLNVPEHAARIDAAVGHQLAPYARAFAGVLVDSKQQARRGNIPGSDIRDFAGKGTGTCGHGGACGANVPVPCYTCPHFQPWLEGPHELIYVQLIEERDEVARTTADPAIAAVLDRTIVAVAEVIQACVSRKEQLRGAGEGVIP